MKVAGEYYQTIWLDPQDETVVNIIDQRFLPFKFSIESMRTVYDAVRAISDMKVRGAGLIGATAGFGMYLAALNAPDDWKRFKKSMEEAADLLKNARPTAVNLSWAVDRQLNAILQASNPYEARLVIQKTALDIAAEDKEACRLIGVHGLKLIEEISLRKDGAPVNILTHCNAGWLAFVDYGTATAPIYLAHKKGIRIHVWVDETRPWNQGSRLTAWELAQERVPHTIITDNAGGYLMQRGMVDMVIVGSDRTTCTGDVANKVGTYLKALAAYDNGVPFYVALPSSTFDWNLKDGINEIPIEERSGNEVKKITGWFDNRLVEVAVAYPESPAVNYVFDVTPARLVTALITERGICSPSFDGIRSLFPEYSGVLQ
ncbi:MAG TPA: S-methyl-5-thioribose-1-phosphate isomerase [Deltaproteobacteria bacterium]|nr:S-methyl-5-thioribose-1-phosphate isomerase [Deltaproteobacteria bacterium]